MSMLSLTDLTDACLASHTLLGADTYSFLAVCYQERCFVNKETRIPQEAPAYKTIFIYSCRHLRCEKKQCLRIECKKCLTTANIVRWCTLHDISEDIGSPKLTWFAYISAMHASLF